MTQIVILLVLFWIAPPTMDYFLEPQTLFEFGLLDAEPPLCRPLTPSEKLDLEIEPAFKKSTYTLEDTAICQRKIFPYGSRDSFYNFVALHSRKRATEVAAQIKSQVQNSQRTYTVRVIADNEKIKKYVSTVFTHELSIALGSGRVLRNPKAQGDYIVDILVRRIQAPRLAFDVRLLPPKQASWEKL